MLERLFNFRSRQADVPQHIYGRVVAQARHPQFYEHLSIPDTPMGRFELLSLHVFVLSHRLSNEKDARAADLGQEVFDAFVLDLDGALRQLGIGDTSVPKRKKRMIATFYTQVDQLSRPLAQGDRQALAASPLIGAIAGLDGFGAADALAAYLVSAKRALEGQSFEDIIANGPAWPEPCET